MNNKNQMIRTFSIVTVLLLLDLLPVRGQGQAEEFTVATLNVDGLPEEVGQFTVNPGGPCEKYTPEIADYLLEKDFDIVGLQENFNFYDLLFGKLEANYHHDDCGGKIMEENFVIPYPFDGISLIWHHGIEGARTDSTCWAQACGLLGNANDELASKGFRRYDLRLKGGAEVVVYNGHWDATDDEDEVYGYDWPDRETRLVQWRQLRDSLLAHLDHRPVIVLGDMNSYFARDSVKQYFIDAIEATGRATVGDAWIMLERQGEYPSMIERTVPIDDEFYVDWGREGETLDKILFVNPTGGGRLTPLSYSIDKEGYRRSDDPTVTLGDHEPIVVRFRIEPAAGSGIWNGRAETPADGYYDLTGKRLNERPTRKGLYIHRGQKYVVK